MFFYKDLKVEDGKARHICTCTLRRAVIVHRSTFCHWKQQTRRQQGESRSITYDKLTLKSKKLFSIISHWVLRRIQSRKQQILWATFKSKQRRSVIYLRLKVTICTKMKFSWKNEKKILFNLLFLFRPFLNKCHVVRHHVLAQQVFRASRESLDPRDQQVLQDHMGIVDPKDPWVLEGARAMKAPEADAVSKVLRRLDRVFSFTRE